MPPLAASAASNIFIKAAAASPPSAGAGRLPSWQQPPDQFQLVSRQLLRHHLQQVVFQAGRSGRITTLRRSSSTMVAGSGSASFEAAAASPPSAGSRRITTFRRRLPSLRSRSCPFKCPQSAPPFKVFFWAAFPVRTYGKQKAIATPHDLWTLTGPQIFVLHEAMSDDGWRGPAQIFQGLIRQHM
ncbi:unnamed protein product [Polarella glacialis]|uniref:Uncharacterized protein n=1 Tax=Polarella glacialis TaxID=89957 RepID=A0A813DNJ8_POLGL|nr:unnamed protein product [Polarella glacialis]